MIEKFLDPYFIINSYTIILNIMIIVVGLVVLKYSYNYLQGYQYKKRYLINMSLLILSTFLLVISNHMLIFFVIFNLSNMFLTNIIIHNSNWSESCHSRYIACKNFALSSIFLGLGFLLLFFQFDKYSFSDINAIDVLKIDSTNTQIALIFITFAIFLQSAIWPFNKWLLSLINSPTPSSAIMHAGLINGGGIILLKLHQLFQNSEMLLNFILIFGLITAIIATAQKLVQVNYKNILACSTSGQMGYMLIQFSLGLIPAMIIHIFSHSLFKSYLFLSHAEQAMSSRIKYDKKNYQVLIGLLVGIICAIIFHYILFGLEFNLNTSVFMTLSSMILCSHIATQILRMTSGVGGMVSTLVLCMLISIIHAGMIHVVEYYIVDSIAMYYYELNIIHYISIFLLVLFWLIPELNIGSYLEKSLPINIVNKVYVALLNSSMPLPKTITSTNSGYAFK